MTSTQCEAGGTLFGEIYIIAIAHVTKKHGLWFMVIHANLKKYFSYIVVVSFIGGENRSTKRKPPIGRKSLTKFITECYIEYTSPTISGDRNILHSKL